MTGTRDTPPDPLQDGAFGELPDGSNNALATDTLGEPELTPDMAQKLGRECYDASTNWLNSGRRAKWTDALRAFQGLHASGSKYLSTDYGYRSRLYRPKTRAMVRKAEAQTAAAFFQNEDVVSITATDDDDPMQQASAEIMGELLQFRLTKTIPWFLTLLGARQDAEVMGVCVGKPYWKYSERKTGTESRLSLHPETGLPQIGDDGSLMTEDVNTFEKTADHPVIDLLAPENFRFDAGADWRNPVATSPYLIEMVPMYVADVRAKVVSGEWLDVSESSILASSNLDDDVTRRAREQGRVPGKDNDAWKPREFDICWVRENILRYGGRDWHFFSLASAGELLTLPRPLEEVYLQGIRPYVCGFVVLEAHKTYPVGKVELVRDLQMAANDDFNLRFDAVKLGLNPRQIVRRGAGIEVTDARTFMPGKVIIAENPREDIVWDRPPEATMSSYAEQDRINLDFDELSGSFNASTMAAGENPVVPETVGGMQMMEGPAASLGEYELRVFAETFVEPIMRHLVKLEQAYETDAVVLAMAGKRAKLFQRFGVSQITDELLNQELTTRVNVGVGATNPQTKLRNFATAMQLIGQLFGPAAAQGANFQEIVKEIAGLSGYKDGERFFMPNFNIQQAMQGMAAGKHGAGAGPSPQELQLRQAELQQQAQESARKAQADQEEIEYRRRFDMGRLAHERQTAAEKHQAEMLKLAGERLFRGQEIGIKQEQLGIERQRFHLDAHTSMGLAPDQLVMGDGSGLGRQIAEHAKSVHDGLAALHQHLEQTGAHVHHTGKQLESWMLGIVNHLNAPKRVVRDQGGRPVGIEHDRSRDVADLNTAIAMLAQPKAIGADASGRIEGTR